MTYTQAVTIRTLQLQGVDIGDKLLNEAIAVIRNTRTPTAWPELGKREEEEPALSDIDALARVHASNYASPHHVTFTVAGLRRLIAEARA